MRTVDPYKWTKKVKKPKYRITTLPLGCPQASTFEMRLRRSFKDAFKELLGNCSAFGIRLMYKDILEPYRYVILVVFLWSVAWATGMFAWALLGYSTAPPLVVSLQAQRHPDALLFPAVSICSHNVISKKALRKYALHLASLDKNSTFSLSQLEQNLVAFGALLTVSSVPFDLHFIRFLVTVGKATNVTNIMLKLSPSCEDLLVRCSWKAKITACHRLFGTQLTPYGFCCVMNSRYRPEDASRAPMTLNTMDDDNGLIVAVQENPDDFAYLRRPGNDVEVILFDGSEFPLKESTGVRSYPAPKNASVYLKLNSWFQSPAPGLKYYSDEARGCSMAEGTGAGTEGWAACLAGCRRRAARVLCSCTPHQLLVGPVLTSSHSPIGPATHHLCTPVHLPCLVKHREMLSYYFPGPGAGGLEQERSDALDCAHCRPPCARASHAAAASRAPLPRQHMFRDDFMTGIDFTNTTIIRVFLTQDEERLYVLESNLRWYQASATIASQWMFICGVSLVSSLEVVYFCTARWYHHYRRRKLLWIR